MSLMATELWSHYWDYDRDRLVVDEAIWAEWLERRVDIHIMAGLRKILNELHAERGWALIFGHTIFGAIEGLSLFAYLGGNDGDKFKQFCSDYLLPNPCPWPNLGEALYHNFRCGLAHGFGIEKGGLTFKEDVPSPEPVTAFVIDFGGSSVARACSHRGRGFESPASRHRSAVQPPDAQPEFLIARMRVDRRGLWALMPRRPFHLGEIFRAPLE